MTNIFPKVFVGSSSEAIPIAEAIQSNLDPVAEVKLWSRGVFGVGEGTLDQLVRTADDMDFCVLVLTPDDVVESRSEVHPSPRDNIIFELGLFIGKIGMNRTFVVYDRENKPKIPSDFSGISHATFRRHVDDDLRNSVGAACNEIKVAMKRYGIRRNVAVQELTSASKRLDGVSDKTKQLLHLLARSRAVELDIFTTHFGALLHSSQMQKIRRDLEDLQKELQETKPESE